MSIVNFLAELMKTELWKVRQEYKWKIPNLEGFTPLENANNYESNIALKKHLARKWQTADQTERLELAHWVIAQWGGVRANKPERLAKYVDLAKDDVVPSVLYGVASYSKLFAIADMDKYVIYDARVAACLNAIQYVYDCPNPIAFNYIPGRNNTVGNTGNKSGFTQDERFKVKTLTEKLGWQRVKRNETYRKYLDVIHAVKKELGHDNVYDLEMYLFAMAEIHCEKAMSL